MIPVISPFLLPSVLYCTDTVVVLPGRAGGKLMRIGREELIDLRRELEQLMSFVRSMEYGVLPYFYRYFDTMKTNIDIFFYTGSEDIADFFPVLERDWKASHTMFIGVQDYDLRNSRPDADPVLCLYFARLLAEVGKYFERGNVEFAGKERSVGRTYPRYEQG